MAVKQSHHLSFYHGRQKYFLPTGKQIAISRKTFFLPIPDEYKYSTTRINYNPKNHRNSLMKVPYLFDKNEVHHGYYMIPRFYEIKGKLEIAPFENWGAPLNLADFNMTGVSPIEFVSEKMSMKGHLRIPKSVNVKAWLHYAKNQCNTSIIVGRMGSGKSLLMNFLLNLCLGKNEAILMATDTFLESRNLALTGRLYNTEHLPNDLEAPEIEFDNKRIKYKQLVILTPVEIWVHKESDIEWVNEKYIKLPNITVHKFTQSNEIFDSIEPGKVVSVYDENLTMETQNRLWYELAIMLNRRRKMDYTITLAHHEASTLLPSHPRKGKFEDVQNFANEYIKFRKAEVRIIFAQQLLTESYWRTNKKTTYIFFKIGSRKDAIYDRKQRNKIQMLSLDRAIVEKDGWWSEHSSPKFAEMAKQVKLLPNNVVAYADPDDKSNEIAGYVEESKIKEDMQLMTFKLATLTKEKHIKKQRGVADDILLSKRTIAEIMGIAPNTVKNWELKGEKVNELRLLKQLQETTL